MKYYSPHFDLIELCCPHVFKKYGEFAWNFFDPMALIVLNRIRDLIGKPIYVNNYEIINDEISLIGKRYTQRGFRCIQCDIVKENIASDLLYVSAHMLGKGFDFDVKEMEAEEVRTWLKSKSDLLPYSIRLERHVPWVHFDVYSNSKGLKIYEFNK
jgi:hypothetical protein